MAVQFILGRSGTGKSGYCIKSIAEALLEPSNNQPLILLVPEQASYQAERSILADKRIAGYNRLNVLSFDRLGFLVSGKNIARPGLSRLGQQMIVHRLLREAGGRLKLFGSSASRPGLGRQMAEAICELHQWAKTPDDIDRLLARLRKDERNNLAALKFGDIDLIFREYLKFIEGKFIDPDIQLAGACQAVAKADLARGARLWVDGFAGFTTGELALLTELIKAAAQVQIALCLDPSKIDLTNPDAGKADALRLFGQTERTYAAFVEIIRKSKLGLAEPIILDRPVRFSHCPPLAHIERNLFGQKPTKIKPGDNIRIVSAPNRRLEVQFAARQILRLVKERNYRYRDIAVIASDIDSYEHYVRAYFDDYGVPFFIDKRRTLNQHPVAQLICSALQTVTGGFSHSDIFVYLKTDLVPVRRYDVDLLENYCLAFGVSGKDWQSDRQWHFAGEGRESFDERRINQIRLKVSEPLLELRNKLRVGDGPANSIDAGQFTQIIFDFLDGLGVREKIGKWIEEAAGTGNYTIADEHRQFYDKFLNVFDELVAAFADCKLSCGDFAAIINSAFSQLTLAFIPPSLDQVLVGSIERSRHPDLKAVFLLGATQSQFPVPVSFDSILTDDDRSAAEAADFPLAAAVSQKLTERQYLAYIAFTRPSELLYITYPLIDDKGGGVVRSQFIADLESLFVPHQSDLSASAEPGVEQICSIGTAEEVHSKSELAELLCSRLGRDVSNSSLDVRRERLGELLDDICADEQFAEVGSSVYQAINYDNSAELGRDVVEKLFARQISSSATKLGTFAACPYRYFARYILELEERKEANLRPLDVGDFYHRVLDALLKRLNEENKDFATVGKEELLKLLQEEKSKIVQTSSFISNFVRHSQYNAFVINSTTEVLEDCVRAIAQMVRAGSFSLSWSEVSFGRVNDSTDRLGEYKIALSGGRELALNGKIDRLDIAEAAQGKIVVVFDYKRREQSFSWSKFYYGLDMQLPIYMLAVRNAKIADRGQGIGDRKKLSPESYPLNPIGAFYVPVEISPQKTTLDELPKKVESFDYKARGLFDGQFARQLDGKTASRDSKFYNFYITKDGAPYGYYGRSSALNPTDFEAALRFTEKKIVELAGQILSGRIEVKPYRLSGKSPCSYCKYRPVCRFDWQINDYNFLELLGKPGVLEKMRMVDG